MPLITIPLPPLELLQEFFAYDPLTGDLRWKKPKGRAKKGTLALPSPRDGYVRVAINRKTYTVHRLIWKIMTGNDPENEVDHRDGNPSNNRWRNLRQADHFQNMANSAPYRKKSGLPRGVAKTTYGSGYAAQIQVNKKLRHLGVFPTPDAAHEAYLTASRDLHGAFALVESRP